MVPYIVSNKKLYTSYFPQEVDKYTPPSVSQAIGISAWNEIASNFGVDVCDKKDLS